MAVEVADGPDGAVVALSGPLSRRTVPEISGGLGKALVNRGCVLVDLSGLRLEWEPGVAVFGSVLGYAGGWPGARMVLFGADGELAAALRGRGSPKPCRWPQTYRRRYSGCGSARAGAPLSGSAPGVRRTGRGPCHGPPSLRRLGDTAETENAAALVVSELTANAPSTSARAAARRFGSLEGIASSPAITAAKRARRAQ